MGNLADLSPILELTMHSAQVTATEQLGAAFESDALKIFGAVLAVCILAVWIFVVSSMIRALWTRQLLWPKEDD